MKAELFPVIQQFIDVLLAALALSSAVLLVAAIIDRGVPLMLARIYLSRRLGRLRLGRMLRLRGIDCQTYLNSTPIGTILRQMSDCRGCGNQQSCFADLVMGAAPGARFAYCPNEKALDGLAARNRTRLPP